MERNDVDRLGVIIKAARKVKGLTREQLTERIHISPRYLMSIENENQKPSYDVLFRLVHEPGISADDIFFPENKSKNTNVERLIRFIYECDDRDTEVVTATVKALLDYKAD